jgi:hypothetical protein
MQAYNYLVLSGGTGGEFFLDILSHRMGTLTRKWVRRGKALDNSGWKSHPGTGSLHPVTIGAVVEAMKPLKPPVQRVSWRPGEHAGRNESER